MLSPLLLLLATAAQVGGPITVTAAPTLFQSPRVPDRELAKMRGGLNLPNGFDVSFAVDLQTRINGVLALHTSYASDGPSAGLHVYGVGGGGAVPAQGVPNVVLSANAAGVSAPTSLTITSNPSTATTPSGGALPVVANGAPVQTAAGTYSLSQNDRGNVVTYDAAGIQVQQLIGQATGIAVANTANNRSIDTSTTVNVNLANVPVAQIAASFVAARAALDAGRAH
jgi:hypothetical protein